VGDYDGEEANIKLKINDNGDTNDMTIKMDNDDIRNLLGIQPVNIPLERRLTQDFLNDSLSSLRYVSPYLEDNGYNRKKRNHTRKRNNTKKHNKKRPKKRHISKKLFF
jgi:DNA replication protein DnaD